LKHWLIFLIKVRGGEGILKLKRNFHLITLFSLLFFCIQPSFAVFAESNPNTQEQTNVNSTSEVNILATPNTIEVNTNKQTQIHLHLKDCPDEFSKVYANVKGEWIELTRQGNSSLFKALDGGEFVKDDISEFKFITTTDIEIVVPVSELKIGVEAEGTINYWLENCQKVTDPNPPQEEQQKNTQIHLHLKDCKDLYLKIFARIKGEWVELTQQGNLPLYKAPNGGLYVKDDITEFKFITALNKEIIIPVSKLKIGVEAEGTINYWLEECLNNQQPGDGNSGEGNKHTQIHLHLKDCVDEYAKIFVKLKGTWVELVRQGNSPLFKTLDGGDYVKDDITLFKFVTHDHKEIIIPLSAFKIGVEAEGTINYWFEQCPNPEVPTDDEDEEGTNTPPAPNDDDDEIDTPTGTLPQTGESSNLLFYMFGTLLTSLGVFLLRKIRTKEL
jgi:LPXTG-motif cell wall-anchored protein